MSDRIVMLAERVEKRMREIIESETSPSLSTETYIPPPGFTALDPTFKSIASQWPISEHIHDKIKVKDTYHPITCLLEYEHAGVTSYLHDGGWLFFTGKDPRESEFWISFMTLLSTRCPDVHLAIQAGRYRINQNRFI